MLINKGDINENVFKLLNPKFRRESPPYNAKSRFIVTFLILNIFWILKR